MHISFLHGLFSFEYACKGIKASRIAYVRYALRDYINQKCLIISNIHIVTKFRRDNSRRFIMSYWM